MAIFTLGEFVFLLTTIAVSFLILIFIRNCFPTSFILLINSESSSRANSTVSSASSGGGVATLFSKKNSAHPRDRCDRFSCYFIKQCVFVCLKLCCCLNNAQFSQDCLAAAAQTS